MPRNIFLLFIFITALFLRIIYCLQTQDFKLESDAVIYDKVGWNLAAGNGFAIEKNIPTAFVFPVYPIFLSFIYRIFGHNLTYVRVIQSLISSLVCILIYLIAKTTFECEDISRLSAIISIIYPSLIIYSEKILNDSVGTFFILGCIYLLISAFKLKKINHWFLAGMVMGICILLRAEYALFIPLIFILLWKINFKEFLPKFLFFVLAVILIVFPWVIRNYIVFNEFPLISTRAGSTLYNSYFVSDMGFSYNQFKNVNKEYFLLKTESEKDKYLMKKTLRYLKNNPFIFFKLIPLKLGMIFYPFDGKWHKLNLLSKYNLLFGLIFCFSIFGIFYIIKNKKKQSYILFIPFLQTIFTCIIFYGKPQYRVPLEPILIILAVVGFFTLKEMDNKKNFYFAISSVFILNLSMFFAGDLITQELKDIMTLITQKLPRG